MAKKKPPPPPKEHFIRVCDRCGEVFETTDERTWCPGGCLHRWGRGNDDPCWFDDIDASKKASKEDTE
jgi:hypothetical protein